MSFSDTNTGQGNGLTDEALHAGTEEGPNTARRKTSHYVIGEPEKGIPLPIKNPTDRLAHALKAMQPDTSLSLHGFSAQTAKKVARETFPPGSKFTVDVDTKGVLRVWRHAAAA